ncbi:hypothetical protein [Aquamicrobium defluvii]|uniref:Uncharacterized protein n=1 Tax=Aquamicrobium defluvii TaxID=69279 RepID=A0A4R6Y1K9_9HYPH|nr:hypothetical protein [Aquamicrobium defluvii]TDR30314.1 hypothetical protein DES43_1464 [Aquamicrobium defluvii]
MRTRKEPTPRGTIYGVEDAIAFVPSDLRAGEIAKPVEVLETALSATIAGIASNSAVYQPEAVAEANGTVVANHLKSAFRSAHRPLLVEARAVAEADAKARQPGPLTDAAYESRFVQSLATMDAPQRISAVANLSFEQSSALVRHGDLDRLELPERVVADVMERHILLGYLARTGSQADYSVKPTFDNPLAVGADQDAAMAAVRPQLAAFLARAERVKLAGELLQGVVRLAAAATGKSIDTVWAEWTA